MSDHATPGPWERRGTWLCAGEQEIANFEGNPNWRRDIDLCIQARQDLAAMVGVAKVHRETIARLKDELADQAQRARLAETDCLKLREAHRQSCNALEDSARRHQRQAELWKRMEQMLEAVAVHWDENIAQPARECLALLKQ